MTPTISLRKALADPQLLGGALAGDSWAAWRTILVAAMGEALTDEERATFAKLTGREREPLECVEEAAFVIGRRGGKSKANATLAAYIAGLCAHKLVRGERGILLCIAPDQSQAAIILDYTTAVFEDSPILSQLIARRTTDTLELTNGISVEVRASSFRRLRGPTYIAVIADEAAFWYSDEWSANTDVEILNAVRPGLATTGGPLIIASSPYSRRGVLWETYRRHHGPQGDPRILVAQGSSRELNPSLPQSVVDRALARDHAAASADYLVQFRTDVESFLSREAVMACVVPDVRERGPIGGVQYYGFCDPAGGSGADAMTLAISHRDGDIVAIDALREVRPPFSPEGVVREFAKLLKSYRITTVSGDHYAGDWPREAFRKRGVDYRPAKHNKSQLYTDLLPVVNSRRLELLDDERLVGQLCSLERRTARAGRDSIDHPPKQHDDSANCVAGAVGSALSRREELAPVGLGGKIFSTTTGAKLFDSVTPFFEKFKPKPAPTTNDMLHQANLKAQHEEMRRLVEPHSKPVDWDALARAREEREANQPPRVLFCGKLLGTR
jgi:hypothetical protein